MRDNLVSLFNKIMLIFRFYILFTSNMPVLLLIQSLQSAGNVGQIKDGIKKIFCGPRVDFKPCLYHKNDHPIHIVGVFAEQSGKYINL